MRLANWHSKEVFQGIMDQAETNANLVMDDVVALAKSKCPVGTITRSGKWSGPRQIAFTARKGKTWTDVRFTAQKVWMGRQPGDLRATIRRVNKRGSGSIRVYAGPLATGDPKIFWAFMVERGTSKTLAQPFLRPAFQQIKSTMLKRIKEGR